MEASRFVPELFFAKNIFHKTDPSKYLPGQSQPHKH